MVSRGGPPCSLSERTAFGPPGPVHPRAREIVQRHGCTPDGGGELSGLEGKVALVTGGASGIGRATCLALARAGARVVVVDIDETGGREVAASVGGDFVSCDVASFEHNLTMVDTALQLHGTLDLVHLNAGIVSGCGIADDFDPERYRRVIGVNLDGVVFGTHAALPARRDQARRRRAHPRPRPGPRARRRPLQRRLPELRRVEPHHRREGPSGSRRNSDHDPRDGRRGRARRVSRRRHR